MQTVYQAAGEAILARHRSLAEDACASQYGRQPGVWERYGEIGRRRCAQDAEHRLAVLAEALRLQHIPLFSQRVAWCKVRYHGLHQPEDTLRVCLECTIDALHAKLPLELSVAAKEYITATIKRLPGFPVTEPSFIHARHPMGKVAARYMDALLRGDRHEARAIAVETINDGATLEEVYQRVLEPTLKEVGRLWQEGQTSVGHEHYSTAATQWIMSQLYTQPPVTSHKSPRLVVACVGGEFHELGARMVSDLFELDGWDSYYLGADCPTHSVLRAVEDRKAELLALSLTMTFNLSQAQDAIAAVRAKHDSAVKIIVGGYPFTVVEGLWKEIGADGSAHSASEAVRLGNKLVHEKHR